MADIFNLTDTWNAGGTTFTAVKMNVTDAASAAGSLLMDLQVGGTSTFGVSKSGATVVPLGGYGVSGFYIGPSKSSGIYSPDGTQCYFVSNGGPVAEARNDGTSVGLGVGNGSVFWAGSLGVSADVSLKRHAAGVLKVTDGAGGAGVFQTPPLTVATLPAAATAGFGSRSCVSDATQTFASANFGATVTGGGSNKVPVFCDGTNWLIG